MPGRWDGFLARLDNLSMKALLPLMTTLQRMLTMTRHTLTWIRKGARAVALVWEGMVRDACFELAAALSYVTLISLVPVSAISVALFKSLGVLEFAQNWVVQLLSAHLIPSSISEVAAWVDTFVTNLNVARLSLLGLVVLVLAALSLFATLEGALNRIWKVKRSRRFLDRFTTFWALLTLGPVLIGYSIYLTAWLQRTAVERGLMAVEPVRTLVPVLGPFFFAWIAFALVYYFVPNTKVRLDSAFAGALLAGTLFELWKRGFNFYVSKVIIVQRSVYGSLGLIPVFLGWVFAAWVILLLGSEISHLIQTGQYQPWATRGREEGSSWTSFLGARSFLMAATRLIAGRPPITGRELAEDLGVSRSEIEEALAPILSEGLLLRAEESGGLVPGVDLARTPASRLLSALRGRELASYETKLAGPSSPYVPALAYLDNPVRDATLGELMSFQRGERDA
jgi:membrane protein